MLFHLPSLIYAQNDTPTICRKYIPIRYYKRILSIGKLSLIEQEAKNRPGKTFHKWNIWRSQRDIYKMHKRYSRLFSYYMSSPIFWAMLVLFSFRQVINFAYPMVIPESFVGMNYFFLPNKKSPLSRPEVMSSNQLIKS